MESYTLQINSELFSRYCDVCKKLGADPQDVAERFFRWCTDHPGNFRSGSGVRSWNFRCPGFPSPIRRRSCRPSPTSAVPGVLQCKSRLKAQRLFCCRSPTT